MAENYLGFYFGSIRVALDNTPTYEGFIVNSGDDLKFSSAPGFSNEFVTPRLGDNSIYTGTTVESRTFSFTVALDSITLAHFRSFLKDFGPEQEGYLRFDYALEYGYMVKLSSIGEATYTVVPDTTDKYIIEIDLEFITTGDWAAIEVNTSVNPPNLFSYLTSDTIGYSGTGFSIGGSSNQISFTNSSELSQYLIVEYLVPATPVLFKVEEYTTSGFTVLVGSILEIAANQLTTGETIQYVSRYGVAISDAGNFVSTTVSIAFEVEVGDTRHLKFNNAATLKIVAREIL